MFYQWKPYVSVAERRRKAEKTVKQSLKKEATLSPVRITSHAIATTFWGKAWCANLERYSDFSNRLPRGRSYVRSGAVMDLRITPGKVAARVVGSRIYTTTVTVTALPKARWKTLATDCSKSIDSLVELMQGRLSKAVMTRICHNGTGLFPAPREIAFDCSCPDWAVMCKHVAAVLYGIGARLDAAPELLFTLRRVDAADLVAHAGTALPLIDDQHGTARRLDRSKIADVFGIELATADAPSAAKPRAKRTSPAGKPARKKRPAKRAVADGSKQPAARRTARRKPTQRANRPTPSRSR